MNDDESCKSYYSNVMLLVIVWLFVQKLTCRRLYSCVFPSDQPLLSRIVGQLTTLRQTDRQILSCNGIVEWIVASRLLVEDAVVCSNAAIFVEIGP